MHRMFRCLLALAVAMAGAAHAASIKISCGAVGQELQLCKRAAEAWAAKTGHAVQVVATATLGAVVASGGLGRYIIDGIARRDHPEVFVGAVLVVLLSLTTELAFNVVQRLMVSPGIRGAEMQPA